MSLENFCWPPTYVATVIYGKEEYAELEIGDALFLLDPEVKVCKTSYGGVLLVKTSLTEDVASKLLLTNPPSTLHRFLKVLFCCELTKLVECLKNNITVLSEIGFSSLRVSERSGVSREHIIELLNTVGYRPSLGKQGLTLSVEPFRNFVCFTKQLINF
ncbi:MAG: hypothetical protein QN229_01620 [Desulfurococcaceae archaeon TW002]